MMKRIALLATVVASLATGCGASRPTHTTVDAQRALTMFANGGTLDEIATAMQLSGPSEAKLLVGTGIRVAYDRYQTVR